MDMQSSKLNILALAFGMGVGIALIVGFIEIRILGVCQVTETNPFIWGTEVALFVFGVVVCIMALLREIKW